jgi:hypothetical protein
MGEQNGRTDRVELRRTTFNVVQLRATTSPLLLVIAFAQVSGLGGRSLT